MTPAMRTIKQDSPNRQYRLIVVLLFPTVNAVCQNQGRRLWAAYGSQNRRHKSVGSFNAARAESGRAAKRPDALRQGFELALDYNLRSLKGAPWGGGRRGRYGCRR
jgi:hypothetical protein